MLGEGPTLTACSEAAGRRREGQAPGGHLTLRPFASSERKRETSPRRLSPTSSSLTAPKSVRCSPAPSSPAPPLWCVAGAGRRDRESDLLAWGGHVVEWDAPGGAHQPLGAALPSPLTLHFPSFLLVLGCLSPPLPGLGRQEQSRPGCPAPLPVGRNLLAARSGAAPFPPSRSLGWVGGTCRLGSVPDVGGRRGQVHRSGLPLTTP